jgi:hypothetical protein
MYGDSLIRNTVHTLCINGLMYGFGQPCMYTMLHVLVATSEGVPICDASPNRL